MDSLTGHHPHINYIINSATSLLLSSGRKLENPEMSPREQKEQEKRHAITQYDILDHNKIKCFNAIEKFIHVSCKTLHNNQYT